MHLAAHANERDGVSVLGKSLNISRLPNHGGKFARENQVYVGGVCSLTFWFLDAVQHQMRPGP
jgi:hypothetical protein